MRLFNTPDGSIDGGDRTFLLTRRFDLDLTSTGPAPVTTLSRSRVSIKRRDGETPANSAVSSIFRRANIAIRRRD